MFLHLLNPEPEFYLANTMKNETKVVTSKESRSGSDRGGGGRRWGKRETLRYRSVSSVQNNNKHRLSTNVFSQVELKETGG